MNDRRAAGNLLHMSETQRNFVILGAIAMLGLVFSGQFGVGAGIAFTVLNIAFAILIIWFLIMLYRRNSGTIALMPATPRIVLQACGIAIVGLLATLMLGVPLVPPTVFWLLVFGCGFGIWWAWQQRTTRW